jgi:hypothetical protein
MPAPLPNARQGLRGRERNGVRAGSGAFPFYTLFRRELELAGSGALYEFDFVAAGRGGFEHRQRTARFAREKQLLQRSKCQSVIFHRSHIFALKTPTKCRQSRTPSPYLGSLGIRLFIPYSTPQTLSPLEVLCPVSIEKGSR